MPRIEILDEAGEELGAIAAKLEAERPGYARIFLKAYQMKLRQIAAFPESGPLIENSPPEFEVRSFLIRKFQHEIIVAVVEGVRTIVAIAPTRREPEYWLERLERIEEG